MRIRNLLTSSFAFSVLMIPVHAYAANPCVIDGNTGATYATPLTLGTTHNPGAGQIACGHTVSGTGCTVQLTADLNAYGSCISLGRGVTLDGNGHALHCDSSMLCAMQAVLTEPTTPTGSGNTVVRELTLSGCWNAGLVHTNTNTAIAEDVVIDYPELESCDEFCIFGQCARGPGSGITSFTTVERASIVNATHGVYLNANNASVEDSVIRDCNTGVSTNGTATGTTLLNCLLDGNTQSVSAGTGSYRIESDGSVLENAGADGHCGPGNDVDDCVDFTGTRASFVDLVIR